MKIEVFGILRQLFASVIPVPFHPKGANILVDARETRKRGGKQTTPGLQGLRVFGLKIITP